MINQVLLDDIYSQPEVLARVLKDLRTQLLDISSLEKSWNRVIFSGSGDSYFAPLSLQYLIRKQQERTLFIISSMEAAHYWSFEPTDLFVAISFSGENLRTVKAALNAKRFGAYILAITSNEFSPLAKVSDAILKMTWASKSRSIPHTVDYTITLLAITRVIEVLYGDRLLFTGMIPDLVQQTLNAIKVPCQELGELLSIHEQYFILGAGPNWGTAQYGTEKLWEACGILGLAFELEEFAHGPHKLITKHTPIFILAPDGQSVGQADLIAEGLETLEATPIIITNYDGFPKREKVIRIPTLPEEWSPFLTCLPLQLLTYSLASAKGYDVVLGEGRVKNIHRVREVQKKWIRSEGI
jgi:glucosamine--fructose-6-phosphate aminotransferase (isomerizing)